MLYRNLNNKVILVVGASGYIGSSLVNELLNYECTIIRATRDIKKFDKLKNNKSIVVDIEMNDNKDISSDLLSKVDIIFYLSSQTSVYIAEQDLQLDFENSVAPILRLFALLKNLNSKPTFIFSSAATICGLTDSLPVDETIPDNPITIYDIHKLLVEKYIKYYIKIGVIKGASLRLANVYGPGICSSNKDRGIINLMVNKALNKQNLTLYGDGEYIRDYIYIDDIIKSFFEVVINIEKTNSKHYYIASEEGHTIKDAFYLIKDLVKNLYNINININNIEVPLNLSTIETRNFYANTSNFKADTHWSAKTNLKQGLIKTFEFYKEN